MLEAAAARTGLALFTGLRRLTRAEAASLNAANALLADPTRWKPWVEEALAGLFQTPHGSRITVTRRNTLGREPEEAYTFPADAVTIGRASGNDIVLPAGSISRDHARLLLRDRELYLEDRGGASGTHIRGQRLEPGQLRRLEPGDDFLVFPYLFRAASEELWAADPELAVAHPQARLTTARAWASLLGPELCVFDLALHPGAGTGVLAVSRPFLEAALARLTRGTVTGLAEGDADLLHFLVLSVLERANRELRFPFLCSLAPRRATGEAGDEAGMALEASFQLTGARGRLLLFLPDSLLRLTRATVPRPRCESLRAAVRPRLSVRLGFVPLTVHDLSGIGPGDVLLYTPEAALLLPPFGAGPQTERGWTLEGKGGTERFTVQAYFERSEGMEEEQKSEETSGFDELPVRVHVVLSEIELSLAELEALGEGSIVELDTPPGSVQLVCNGKVVGAGELVEVEDRLGVEITRWGQS